MSEKYEEIYKIFVQQVDGIPHAFVVYGADKNGSQLSDIYRLHGHGPFGKMSVAENGIIDINDGGIETVVMLASQFEAIRAKGTKEPKKDINDYFSRPLYARQ